MAIDLAIAEGLGLAHDIAEIVKHKLNPSQHDRIQDVLGAHRSSCDNFAKYLLAGDRPNVNLMLFGLPSAPGANLSAAELERLHSCCMAIPLDQVLGYYCRARYVRALQEIVAILMTADKPK